MLCVGIRKRRQQGVRVAQWGASHALTREAERHAVEHKHQRVVVKAFDFVGSGIGRACLCVL